MVKSSAWVSYGFVLAALAASCSGSQSGKMYAMTKSELYRMPDGVETRWSSFENPGAEKGKGGSTNKGAKGHAYEAIHAGETKTLFEFKGSGVVRRIWMTVSKRDPESLRALRIEMYWDGAATPAVSAPLGDFFAAIGGRMSTFENELFASPEGRSFNCYIPMPFRTGARITLTNDGASDVPHVFYDVDATVNDPIGEDVLYFHAVWHRERPTTLGRDFEILPAVSGRGRFLGTHVTVEATPGSIGWWGEGEIKMYLDGDKELPTIVGTGTEDYIGTGWGQSVYSGRFQGSLTVDNDRGVYGFYRYHVPDPIWFYTDCRVTLQQIGGANIKEVRAAVDRGLKITPISLDSGGGDTFQRFLESDPAIDVHDTSLPDGWVNFYREDDVSAVALFYLDRAENGLPKIATVGERTADLRVSDK